MGLQAGLLYVVGTPRLVLIYAVHARARALHTDMPRRTGDTWGLAVAVAWSLVAYGRPFFHCGLPLPVHCSGRVLYCTTRVDYYVSYVYMAKVL